MAIPYEKIVEEDLHLGHGSASVTMPAGGSATGTLVGLHTFTGQLNVKSFGAVGDGASDDTSAIQAALTAATANQDVVLPAGTYVVRTGLTIPTDGVRLIGMGYSSYLLATLPADSAVITATGRSRVEVRDIRFGGTFTRAVQLVTCTESAVRRNWISGATITAVTDVTSGINLLDCTDVEVVANRCSGNGAGASNTVASLDIIARKLTTGCLRIRIHGNVCTSTLVTMHIGVEDSSYCHVFHNHCAGATDKLDHSAWGYGIYFYNSTIVTDHNVCHHNTITNTKGSGIYLVGTRYSTVDGNVLENVCQTETTAGSLAVGGIALNGGCDEGHVVNNIVRTVTQQCGIRTDAIRSVVAHNTVTSAPTGILIGPTAAGSRIAGNSISNCVNSGISHFTPSTGLTGVSISNNDTWLCGYGISVDAFYQVTVSGNTVRANNFDGIVMSNCLNVTVLGNLCFDNNQTTSTYAGIHLVGNTYVLVSLNRCMNVVGNVQKYGISLDTCGSVKYGLNMTEGNLTAETLITSCTGNLASVVRVTDQVLATGAVHTVDDVITMLQTLGLVKQA